jgi:hypothetical protein
MITSRIVSNHGTVTLYSLSLAIFNAILHSSLTSSQISLADCTFFTNPTPVPAYVVIRPFGPQPSSPNSTLSAYRLFISSSPMSPLSHSSKLALITPRPPYSAGHPLLPLKVSYTRLRTVVCPPSLARSTSRLYPSDRTASLAARNRVPHPPGSAERQRSRRAAPIEHATCS